MTADMREERRRHRKRLAARGSPRPLHEERGETEPTTEAVEARRAAMVEPFIQELRRQLFGSPDPPFRSEEDPALREWELRFRLYPESEPYDKALEAMSEGTGFSMHDLDTWILTGKRPRLSPWIIRFPAKRFSLPDGTELRRSWVELVVNVPIQEAEIRRIWRHMNQAWTDPSKVADFGSFVRAANGSRCRRTPKLTDHDTRLLAFVEAHPEATWADRAAIWREKSGEERRPDALRMAFHRAVAKLDLIEGGTDD